MIAQGGSGNQLVNARDEENGDTVLSLSLMVVVVVFANKMRRENESWFT